MGGARPETHPARRPGVRPATLQHERIPEVRLPALARRDRRLDRRDVRAGFPPDEVDEELGRCPDFAREVGCFFGGYKMSNFLSQEVSLMEGDLQ